ncbi:MAG: hypothetical protein HY921_02450 [Elusimicrobia bacterium]|nr:hypothetical protein [Elusimicrobiota bacterium]
MRSLWVSAFLVGLMAASSLAGERGMIVPAYIYYAGPEAKDYGNPRQFEYWERLKSLSRRYKDSEAKLVIIINPSSGPGSEAAQLKLYRELVAELHKYNTKVLGYARTDYGAAILAAAKDVAQWHRYVPALDGFFFDEVGLKEEFSKGKSLAQQQKEFRKRYAPLKATADALRNKMIIYNAGGYWEYMSYLKEMVQGSQGSRIACIMERAGKDFGAERGLRAMLEPWAQKPEHSLVLLHHEPSPQQLLGAYPRSAAWIYATNGDWDSLPGYLEDMAQAVLGR